MRKNLSRRTELSRDEKLKRVRNVNEFVSLAFMQKGMEICVPVLLKKMAVENCSCGVLFDHGTEIAILGGRGREISRITNRFFYFVLVVGRRHRRKSLIVVVFAVAVLQLRRQVPGNEATPILMSPLKEWMTVHAPILTTSNTSESIQAELAAEAVVRANMKLGGLVM